MKTSENYSTSSKKTGMAETYTENGWLQNISSSNTAETEWLQEKAGTDGQGKTGCTS